MEEFNMLWGRVCMRHHQSPATNHHVAMPSQGTAALWPWVPITDGHSPGFSPPLDFGAPFPSLWMEGLCHWWVSEFIGLISRKASPGPAEQSRAEGRSCSCQSHQCQGREDGAALATGAQGCLLMGTGWITPFKNNNNKKKRASWSLLEKGKTLQKYYVLMRTQLLVLKLMDMF